MPQGYHEPKDPRTNKAPNHQAAANKHNISDVVKNWNISFTIDDLKSKTNVGDKYELYYGGKQRANQIIVITRFNDKSVWHTTEETLNTPNFYETRESWNTVLNYIKNRVYRSL